MASVNGKSKTFERRSNLTSTGFVSHAFIDYVVNTVSYSSLLLNNRQVKSGRCLKPLDCLSIDGYDE